MKIAYIISKQKTARGGEAEKNARELALQLAEKGHSVEFHTSFLSVLFQNFDVVHFVSDQNKPAVFLAKFLKRKTAIITASIPFGVSFTREEKYERIKELGFIKNSYLLFSGKIVKNSGAFLLSEAFKLLEDKHLSREKKLVIATIGKATGEYAKELKDAIRGRENILLLENLPKETLQQLMSHCYLFVSSNETAKTPRELLEAMSCGAAVLASGHKDNLRLLGEDAGFSFEPRNVFDLESKLVILINSPLALRDVKEKAQKIIEKKYSLGHLVFFMENLYLDEVLQKQEKITFKTYEKNI